MRACYLRAPPCRRIESLENFRTELCAIFFGQRIKHVHLGRKKVIHRRPGRARSFRDHRRRDVFARNLEKKFLASSENRPNLLDSSAL